MKLFRNFCVILLSAMSFTSVAQVCYNNATPADPDSGIYGFITNRDTDTGCKGLHISELQLSGATAPGVDRLLDFGFGIKAKNNRTLADDFTLSKRSTLANVKLYPYKNRIGSTTLQTTPIIESAYLRIWNGKPGEPGSAVIHGNLADNVLVSSIFTGIYRTNDNLVNSCDRPIMEVTADLKCVILEPG